MTDSKLPLATMYRLCTKAGAERVSESAKKEPAMALEEIGVRITKEALDFCIHAGRRTVKVEDIEIAIKKTIGTARYWHV